MKRLKLPHMIFISALSLLMLVSLLMAAYKGPVSAQIVDFNAYRGATIPDSYIDGTIGPEWEDAGEYVDVALDPMMPPYGVADIWTKHDGTNLYIAVKFYADSNNPWLAIMFSPWGSLCKGDDIILFGNDNLSPDGYSDAYFIDIETVPADTDSSPPGTQDGVGVMELGEGNLITIELKKPLDSGDWRGLDISWQVGETQKIVIAWDSDGAPVTAPNRGGSSGGSASHRNATYRERGIFIDPGRKPGFVPSIFAKVTANPTMISSNQTSSITVQVTELGLDAYGGSEANVTLSSDKGGSFLPSSGYSDSNGYFSSTFSPPRMNESTSLEVRISAAISKSGFPNNSNYVNITVFKGVRPLSVTVAANPASVESEGSSTITMNVTDGFDNSPVPDATITLSSDNEGTFLPESGNTNASGILTSTFTAPSTIQEITVKITANVDKTDYFSAQGQTQVTVKPMEEPIALLWILIGIAAISIVVIVVFVTRRGKRDKTYEKMRKHYEEVARII